MAQFNLQDYEPVQERIPKFLERYEAPRILTFLRSDINELSIVVFEAQLFDGEMLLSTGWAFEKEGAGYVNKTSHLENCETSAIGRALANIGIHGDKRPSREEMQKARAHGGGVPEPAKPAANGDAVMQSEAIPPDYKANKDSYKAKGYFCKKNKTSGKWEWWGQSKHTAIEPDLPFDDQPPIEAYEQ